LERSLLLKGRFLVFVQGRDRGPTKCAKSSHGTFEEQSGGEKRKQVSTMWGRENTGQSSGSLERRAQEENRQEVAGVKYTGRGLTRKKKLGEP